LWHLDLGQFLDHLLDHLLDRRSDRLLDHLLDLRSLDLVVLTQIKKENTAPIKNKH